ncbi:MAG: hypothetical protein IPG94_22215 [Kineosporiaceae bacterium]|nr:hypothetical protein [Kineosporiaceae bacterium]
MRSPPGRGIDPAQIGFVEAHGTGSRGRRPVGDGGDRADLGTAPGRRTGARGSIKASVGHLEAAAGVTSVIKAALTPVPPSDRPRQGWPRSFEPGDPVRRARAAGGRDCRAVP